MGHMKEEAISSASANEAALIARKGPSPGAKAVLLSRFQGVRGNGVVMTPGFDSAPARTTPAPRALEQNKNRQTQRTKPKTAGPEKSKFQVPSKPNLMCQWRYMDLYQRPWVLVSVSFGVSVSEFRSFGRYRTSDGRFRSFGVLVVRALRSTYTLSSECPDWCWGV